jgi:hypothetical protein
MMLLLCAEISRLSALDLTKAVVLSPPNLSGPEAKAVAMLVEEVEKRSAVHWNRTSAWPSSGVPMIAVSPVAGLKLLGGRLTDISTARGGPEGFEVGIRHDRNSPVVFVIGNDSRGVLFGVGYLLRALRMRPGHISLSDDTRVATVPQYRLRGHQLGFRPKTNSYDAWDLDSWEQYIRDLAVFGCNAIELIPPRSDDDALSPHFPRPPMEMMVGMSRLADEYGLDVWIWYPAMDKDYADASTVEFALKEWGEVFKKLPRIDAVFVPGGDPGHTQPKILMALLEKQTQSLRRSHPKAQMWVSPQSFSQPWLEEFLAILNHDQPAWLSGVVFGPQVRIGLPQLRAAVPAKYPIRHYPDITHSRRCEYPVPDWDRAFAFTSGREGINPRPLDEAAIFHLCQPDTIGFLTYSEGCNDDVNKVIWSALGWDPGANVTNILREYSRYFIGDRYSEDFAQGLLALEKNWRGPLLANKGVYQTLKRFQALEKSASAQDLRNWRFQQALYRAYYDAYTRSRLIHETELEEKANNRLRQAHRRGSLQAMSEAEAILARANTDRAAAEWRTRVFELAEALYQSIRMQLSVEKYKAIALDRGATLDSIDVPLNNLPWLQERFARIRKQSAETERLQAIDELVHWTEPGPGGFYDDLGDPARQPHLLRGPGFAKDPDGFASACVGCTRAPVGRSSWWDFAESLYEMPLTLRYTELDPSAQYRLRVVYAGDHPKKKIRLVANDGIEIHPFRGKDIPLTPVEFDIPRQATDKGALTLSWTREPGLGDDGRGCQVAEVWLLKK